MTNRKLTIDMNSERPVEVCGQQLLVDVKFEKLLNDAGLTVSDLEEIAQKICQWMPSRGWLISNQIIAFVVDEISRENNEFLFGFNSAETINIDQERKAVITGVINAFSDKVYAQISTVQKLSVNRNAENEAKIRKAIPSSIGFSIAHEICHAFGINRRHEPFMSMDSDRLELLTDCVAYASCAEFLGKDTAFLGAFYIRSELEKMGLEVNASTVESSSSGFGK